MPVDVKKLIYISMIQSHLSYMIEIWGCASSTRIRMLQTMQNRALRNVFDIPYLTARHSIYSTMSQNILPVKGLYELAVSKFVFKVMNYISFSEIHFTSASHNYSSRYRGLLTRPRCKTEGAKKRLSYSGPHVFNALPSRCKSIRTLNKFKMSVREHLSSNEQIQRLI